MREIEIVLLQPKLCRNTKLDIRAALEDLSYIPKYRSSWHLSRPELVHTILHHFPSLRSLDEATLRKYFDEEEYEIVRAYRIAIDVEGGIRNASSETLEILSRADDPLLFRIARKAIPLELSNICFGSMKFGERFLQKELEEIDKLLQQLESGEKSGSEILRKFADVRVRIDEKVEDLEKAIKEVIE